MIKQLVSYTTFIIPLFCMLINLGRKSVGMIYMNKSCYMLWPLKYCQGSDSYVSVGLLGEWVWSGGLVGRGLRHFEAEVDEVPSYGLY